ncbi:hypothetical protein DM02DRAFT_632247 [Periconia macrospinosa]|uniref:Uncharacterized protein n=1 Tax=Periconia macrospinosa TaxID=97972 RepID=A0A2V1DEW3_9PLEO|nr:hypothetical protein DM02DRAFT_632247 [Periconia macrospinosa]
MKLSLALVTALLGVVAAIPAPEADLTKVDLSNVTALIERGIMQPRDAQPIEGHLEKRCASGFFCSAGGEKQCYCNQGRKCSCTFIPAVEPGFPGYWAWLCWDCPVPANGGLQCIDGECNHG